MTSLRGRLWAYLAAVAVASAVLTVVVAVVLTRQHAADQRLTTLDRQADAIAAVATPGSTRVLLVGARGGARLGGRARVLGPRRARMVLARVGAGNAHGQLAIGGAKLLYATRATPGGRVVVLRRAGPAPGDAASYAWSIVFAGLGGALLAGALSFVLARRLTRPVDEVAGAAARLAGGEERVTVPVRGRDELSRLAVSFNAMSDQLARAREAQRTFLLSVSHELKTPLTAVRGWAEALGDGAAAPREAAAAIEGEALRLQRLVGDLLDLARLDRAGFAIERRPIELGALAGQALERHRAPALEAGVTLAADAPDDPAWGLGDPDRVLQAISNLVENALRVTPAGGRVDIDVAPPATLTVRDTGPGLASEDLPRAFERFHLHDRYRGRRGVGSGLGLAIVRQVVEAMGGTVAAAGEPGRGAAFTLRLEPAPAPAEPVAASPAAHA